MLLATLYTSGLVLLLTELAQSVALGLFVLLMAAFIVLHRYWPLHRSTSAFRMKTVTSRSSSF